MADWRSLITQEMGQDVAARREAGVSVAFSRAIANMRATDEQRRAGKIQSQHIAESATYGAYPEVAAKRAGIGLPEGVGGAPSGMRETKRTVGGRVYEAPEELDAQFFAKEYMKYKTAIEEQNTINKVLEKPLIKMPGWTDWMKGTFPEYADEVLKSIKKQPKKLVDTGGMTLTATGDRYAADVDALVEYYEKANPEKSRVEIIEQMKKAGLIK